MASKRKRREDMRKSIKLDMVVEIGKISLGKYILVTRLILPIILFVPFEIELEKKDQATRPQ